MTVSIKKAAPLVAQQEPQSQERIDGVETSRPIPILSNLPPDVKLLQEFQQRNIPNTDIIKAMQIGFKGFDKSLLSKCRNQKKYGVGLTHEAVKLLAEHFGAEAPAAPRQPNRAKARRIQCRLTDEMYGRVQQHLVRTGQSMQGFLEQIIMDHLKREASHGEQLQ